MAMVAEVRNVVSLLMKRPITEEIALEVEATEGFGHLEIEGGTGLVLTRMDTWQAKNMAGLKAAAHHLYELGAIEQDRAHLSRRHRLRAGRHAG